MRRYFAIGTFLTAMIFSGCATTIEECNAEPEEDHSIKCSIFDIFTTN